MGHGVAVQVWCLGQVCVQVWCRGQVCVESLVFPGQICCTDMSDSEAKIVYVRLLEQSIML